MPTTRQAGSSKIPFLMIVSVLSPTMLLATASYLVQVGQQISNFLQTTSILNGRTRVRFLLIVITIANFLDTSFLPQMEKDTIKLYDPVTHSIVDTYVLNDYEIVMSIKSLSLEVSENTHARKPLIAIGTAIVRGEDCQTTGRVHILEIIEVIPEPDRPETGYKLKAVALEDIKGAVTALSPVGTEGLLLIAEGQKCLVRGLKEDGTFLPVALMDMQCYASVLKELPQSGLCILGDAVRGLWFAGYGVSLCHTRNRLTYILMKHSGGSVSIQALRTQCAGCRSPCRRFPP